MGHSVLDPLQKRGVCFLEECPVVVVTERRQLKEVNEEPCHFVAVFHDECVEFRLGIRKGNLWAEVDEELLDK